MNEAPWSGRKDNSPPLVPCPDCGAALPQSGSTCPGCGATAHGWLSRGGEVFGPYDVETLAYLFRHGRLTPEDLVTWDLRGNWQPAGQVFGEAAPPSGRPMPSAPPPAPAPAPIPTATPPSPARGRSNPQLYLVPLLALAILAGSVVVFSRLMVGGVGDARETAQERWCAQQLQVIALSMRMYLVEYGEVPVTDWPSALEARQVSPDLWICPGREDKVAYQVAERVTLAQVEEGSPQVPLVWDAPLPDGSGPHKGKFNVVYADGHIAAESALPIQVKP